MASERPASSDALAAALSADWPFPASAALGSSVRARGIEREILHRLPRAARAGLLVEDGRIALRLPDGEAGAFEAASRIVSETLAQIHALPVLPGEAEDILTILPRERLKWMKDGRLKSAGTRTVQLRGRAKAVTFHVFEPHHIEDALDRDLPSVWRAQDARTSAENRKRAAAKAASTRAGRDGAAAGARGRAATPRRRAVQAELEDWASFEADGLLR